MAIPDPVWTAADLAELERSIAMAEKTVEFSDGRRVSYKNLGEMMQIRDIIRRSLADATEVLGERQYRPVGGSGL